jgi:hypothetical protein
MTELQDIFAEAAATTVFLYGSAVCLLVSALAALWLTHRGERAEHWTRAAIGRATLTVAAVLALTLPSVGRAEALDTTTAIECALHDAATLAQPDNGCEWAQGRVVRMQR